MSVKLRVCGEISGERVLIGLIETVPGLEERFTYDESFMARFPEAVFSISLPFQREPFSARATRAFFRNMLPEGEALAAVAKELEVRKASYLKVLSALGSECIGAVIVQAEGAKAAGGDGLGYDPLPRERLASLVGRGAEGMACLQKESRLSLAGAQSKMGLYVSTDAGKAQYAVPRGTAASTHIVKAANRRFEQLSENEHCCLALARACGLKAASSFIDVMDGGEALFVVERFDRVVTSKSGGCGVVARLHQEDLCQALGKAPEHKYEKPGLRYARQVREVLQDYAENPAGDVMALAKLLVLNVVIGNCDGHLKNLSLVRSADWSSSRLSPVYDIASTVVYEGLDRHMGMLVGNAGKVDEVTRGDLADLAKELQLTRRAVDRIVEEVRQGVSDAVDEIVEEMEDDLGRSLGKLHELRKFARSQIARLA